MDFDYLSASNGTGDAATLVVQAVRAAGSPTLTVDKVTGVPSKFIGTYGDRLPSGLIDPTTKVDFKGHLNSINSAKLVPGTAGNNSSYGASDWVSPSNLVSGTAATHTTASSTSHFLTGSNYGFNIPTTAIITGIKLEVQAKVSVNNIGNHANEAANGVQLLKAGTPTVATGITTYGIGTSYATSSYGGDGNLWGTTWTPADINSSGFGAAYAISKTGTTTVSVLSMVLTVYYYDAGSTITIDSFLEGSIDIGNSQNQIVQIKPNTPMANRIAAYLAGLIGVGTLSDVHGTTLTAANIVTDELNLVGNGSTIPASRILDGVADPTYRYTITGTDLSNGYAFVSFAHGFTAAPRVHARFISQGLPLRYCPMPNFRISNQSYNGLPPSASIVVQSVDATNINVGISFTDGLGLSFLVSNYQLQFQFFCSPFAAAL